MPHHQKIRVHCVQRQRRVNQGFALFDRTGLHGHIHHIRAQPFTGQLERGLRTGGVFKKHIDLGETGQHIGMFVRSPVQINIAVGKIKNFGNSGGGKWLNAQKVFVGEPHKCAPLNLNGS